MTKLDTDLVARIACYIYRESIVSGEDLHAEFSSPKWCKIYTHHPHGGRTIYRFIALQDGTTKAHGDIKAGHVHRAKGWATPHKLVDDTVWHPGYDPEANPDALPIDTAKPKPNPRHLLASTIVNEIVAKLGIPKARLHARWDGGDCLQVTVTDAKPGETDDVLDYLNAHKARIGIPTRNSSDCAAAWVMADGEHDPDLLDTHDAIDLLDRMSRRP